MGYMLKCTGINRSRKRKCTSDNGSAYLFCQFKNNFIFVPAKKVLKKIKNKQVAYENNDKKMESVYSQRIRAGKRRTYFFDVRETRGNDYYLTITESRKKFNEDGYDRHKIFLYKEDFNKFLKGMTEAIDYVKTELMPDFDFDAFNHENSENYEGHANEEKKETEHTSETNESESSAAEKVEDKPTPVTNSAPPETSEEPKSPDEPINPIHHEEVDKW